MSAPRIVIIGGSIPGFMVAILCAKHSVLVLEQSAVTNSTESRAACVLGPYARKMFEHHIPSPELLSAAIPNQELLSIVTVGGHIKHHMSYAIGKDYPMSMTSWGAVHQVLTQAFETRKSSQAEARGTGTVTLRTRAKVISAKRKQGAWEIIYDTDGIEQVVTSDILIGADASHSIIRSLVSSSSDTKPAYAGYAAWRGRLPYAMHLPTELDGILDGKLVWINMPQHYISMYAIPNSDKTSRYDASKRIEFCWYFRYNRDSPELESIMNSLEGMDRNVSDDLDSLRAGVWRKHLDMALKDIPSAIRSMLYKCETPQITKITSIVEENASYYNGKLFLIGEAFSRLPPHLGCSLDVAAMQAITLKDLFENEGMEPQDWNNWVVDYARNSVKFSVDIGEFGMMEWDAIVANAW